MTLRSNASKAILGAFLSLLPACLLALNPKLDEGLDLFNEGRYGDAYALYNEVYFEWETEEDQIAAYVGRACVDFFFTGCAGTFERSMEMTQDFVKYKDKEMLMAYIKEHTPYDQATEAYFKLNRTTPLCERSDNPNENS